jgi:hypothetical protein
LSITVRLESVDVEGGVEELELRRQLHRHSGSRTIRNKSHFLVTIGRRIEPFGNQW